MDTPANGFVIVPARVPTCDLPTGDVPAHENYLPSLSNPPTNFVCACTYYIFGAQRGLEFAFNNAYGCVQQAGANHTCTHRPHSKGKNLQFTEAVYGTARRSCANTHSKVRHASIWPCT